MEVDAFTKRQQLLNFINSLHKLGQSCDHERHLSFNIILRLATCFDVVYATLKLPT